MPTDRTDRTAAAGSQSKVPGAIFWIVLAAVLFRIVTAVVERRPPTDEAGLVSWVPLARAVSSSASQGKPILYDFTADWCPPCHRLDAEGWGDAAIARLVNDSYLATRVLDREREEGKNPPAVAELRRRYSVGAFPTLVVTSPDGREIARHEGYRGRRPLIEFLEASRKPGVGPPGPAPSPGGLLPE